MRQLNLDYIKNKIADSAVVFQRGMKIFNNGGYYCREADRDRGYFEYEVDGNYGDYDVTIQSEESAIKTSCNCPYPADGCKHVVAMALDVFLRYPETSSPEESLSQPEETDYLNADEIRDQAIEDRKSRASSEQFSIEFGDMFKDAHFIETEKNQRYKVTIFDPENGKGHCDCLDFLTNQLGVCKHIFNLTEALKEKEGYAKKIALERFPYVNVYWDSMASAPRLWNDRPEDEIPDILPLINEVFDDAGRFDGESLADLERLANVALDDKRLVIEDSVLERINDKLHLQHLSDQASNPFPSLDFLKIDLYPYQRKGVEFGLYRKSVLIGDEMGLGKTIQAICLAILKREIFGFDKVLVVTLASLKEQWKREIERYTDERATIIFGNPKARRKAYENTDSLFKITNYEAVRNDVSLLTSFDPDIVILDEAQRIKNFTTKTAEATKRVPKKHGIVLTGTPLENKLEDVYSIVQFLDPAVFAPLWKFAADYFMLSREKKGKILGYRNLDQIRAKLEPIVLRRRKEEVLDDLPAVLVNDYYIDLTPQQREIHDGFAASLAPILHKKFLTPMDMQRIQRLLLMMRMTCDSTYLVDRDTNISPKLKELESILDELIIQNCRKVVIFSEWTTMTYLIAKYLSKVGIDFVELTGKIPSHKRQALIDEFSNNPDCRVFLSSDAGGTGLNLQAADCVINFELPWNPAKISQRVGRVNRIGQLNNTINVINLIAKNSVEENIMAGLEMKRDLFQGVFDGTTDRVEFTREKRQELLEKLKGMIADEQVPPSPESAVSEEIPEDTPHFLNPKALSEEETIEYVGEEDAFKASQSETVVETDTREPSSEASPTSFLEGQSTEKVEEVLNNGLNFIGGLLEMATGKKLEGVQDQSKMISIDKDSGEVTMKFKLPGF